MNRWKWTKVGVSLVVMGTCLAWARADETGTPQPGAAPAATGSSRPGKVWTQTVHVKATVVDIDKKKRTLALKGPEGNVFDLTVGPSVKRFNEIEKGDTVDVSYLESTALYVQSPGEAPAVTGSSSYMVANKGELPSGVLVTSEQTTSTVQKIDYNTREITLLGPDGKTRTIIAGAEVKRFAEIKEGDQIVSKYTKAVAISVNKV